MEILEKYNIIRARNISIIDNAKTHYFEVNKSILVNISQSEALRLEDTYASIIVDCSKDSAFLSSRPMR